MLGRMVTWDSQGLLDRRAQLGLQAMQAHRGS